MKYMYIITMIFILTQSNFYYLEAMERNDSYSNAQLLAMNEAIKQSARIGEIGTLILSGLIKEGYYETKIEDINAHQFIKTIEQITPKSYTFKRSYNPFIIMGSCENNNTSLAKALLLTLQNGFITEHETNDLNNRFFDIKDKPQGFTQVDYCTSAKYANEKLSSFVYIARFFNKESLEHTMQVLASQNDTAQTSIKKLGSNANSDSSDNT